MLLHLLKTRPYDATEWIVIVLLTILIMLAIHRNKPDAKHRAFSLYIHFQVFEQLVLMFIPVGEGFRVFTWLSYSWSTVSCLLMAVAIAEIYSRAIGPLISLPAWVPRNLAVLLTASVSFGLALGVIFWPKFGTPGQKALMGTQEIMVIVMALSLWILIFKAAVIGVRWRPRTLHIAAGFVLMLSVNACTYLAMLTGAKSAGYQLQRVGLGSAIIALGWWSWKLWEKEPASRRASDEEIHIMLARHQNTIDALRGEKVI